MLIAPVLIDSRICRVFGSVLVVEEVVGNKIFFLQRGNSPEICLLLWPPSDIPSVLQVAESLPTNGEIDCCGLRGMKHKDYTWTAKSCQCNSLWNPFLLIKEPTCIARRVFHRKPLTAPQRPSCRFLCFLPPENLLGLEFGLWPENLEEGRDTSWIIYGFSVSHHIFPTSQIPMLWGKMVIPWFECPYCCRDQYYQFLVLRNDQIDISGAGNFLSVDRTRGRNYTIKTDVSSNFLIFFIRFSF